MFRQRVAAGVATIFVRLLNELQPAAWSPCRFEAIGHGRQKMVSHAQ
jgi:hypothetical protein